MRMEFQWLTDIRITRNNAEKIAGAGRKHWKIENEGFNRQKNWHGYITHACNHGATAMKKKGIKKKQKIYLPNCWQTLDGN